MDKDFKTGPTALAHYIYQKGLLMYKKNGKYEPLRLSSIETEVSEVWREMKAEYLELK